MLYHETFPSYMRRNIIMISSSVPNWNVRYWLSTLEPTAMKTLKAMEIPLSGVMIIHMVSITNCYLGVCNIHMGIHMGIHWIHPISLFFVVVFVTPCVYSVVHTALDRLFPNPTFSQPVVKWNNGRRGLVALGSHNVVRWILVASKFEKIVGKSPE